VVLLRAAVSGLVVAVVAATVMPRRLSGLVTYGDPLPGLTGEQQARFEAGKREFSTEEEATEGLGPVFNDTSCANCHTSPAVGGGSAVLETRFGRTDGQAFDPMTEFGGSLMQSRAIDRLRECGHMGETVPTAANRIALRRTTPLFGLGLVDAVPDATFHAVAAAERDNPDHIAGRPHIVKNVVTNQFAVGRFGWKAQVPTLLQFSGDAYLNELGITNPIFPHENCPSGDCAALKCDLVPEPEDDGHDIVAVADFMTLLAPPGRLPVTPSRSAGEQVFTAIGCANCHLPALRTGHTDVAAFDRVTFYPYSDFLLHDMGSLGDGISQGDAHGQEMRTAPLWGLRAIERFLHDGRGATIEDAIVAHDGQGARSRDRFVALDNHQRHQLLAFLKSL
jgi:CxxC motif-containing protein (DUF1111 family)